MAFAFCAASESSSGKSFLLLVAASCIDNVLKSSAVCAFDQLKGAVDTTIQTIQLGIPIARIELLDEVQMDAVNRYSNLDHPVKPTLFLEFHGSPAGVAEQAGARGQGTVDDADVGFCQFLYGGDVPGIPLLEEQSLVPFAEIHHHGHAIELAL